jgi:hypothetical protein
MQEGLPFITPAGEIIRMLEPCSLSFLASNRYELLPNPYTLPMVTAGAMRRTLESVNWAVRGDEADRDRLGL